MVTICKTLLLQQSARYCTFKVQITMYFLVLAEVRIQRVISPMNVYLSPCRSFTRTDCFIVFVFRLKWRTIIGRSGRGFIILIRYHCNGCGWSMQRNLPPRYRDLLSRPWTRIQPRFGRTPAWAEHLIQWSVQVLLRLPSGSGIGTCLVSCVEAIVDTIMKWVAMRVRRGPLVA